MKKMQLKQWILLFITLSWLTACAPVPVAAPVAAPAPANPVPVIAPVVAPVLVPVPAH